MRYIDKIAEVTSQRRNGYGRPLINFLRIALYWSNYLGRYISPIDVAMLMSLLKVSREMHTHDDDNLVDLIGYIDCIESINDEMIELGYQNGSEAFKAMNLGDLFNLIEMIKK